MLKKIKNFISDKWQRFKKIIIIAIFGGVALAAGLGGIPQDIYNNLNVKVYTACNLQEARRASIESDFKTFKARNPDNSLRELNATERASIKTCEMAKRKTEFVGIYTSAQYGVKIEIIGDVKKIEINGQHGIELFAKAWRGTQQLGFGADGTVEIERFRIFNPPILVDDPNGIIIQEWTDKETGEFKQRKLREDLIEATRQVISHNVKIVGKDNNKIIKGKIGNTTSTFYPADDGTISPAENATWATVHDATSGTFTSADGNGYIYGRLLAGTFGINRYFSNIDTSAIGTDTITSATYSVNSDAKGTDDSRSFNVYNSTHSVPIVGGDFDLAGTTAYATAITMASWSVTGYNDFTLLTPDDGKINKTGTTKLSIRDVEKDTANVAPVTTANTYVHIFFVLNAGNASDPKLVVVHTGAAAAGEEYQIIFD